MPNSLMKIIYRLGGATYDVIRYCSPDTKVKYTNLAYSLLLSTVLAAIGGYDIAQQFTKVIAFCIIVSILWGTAVFSFDYFLINGGAVGKFFKYIRVPVGMANVSITIIALFVLLNQSTIDTSIKLDNANKVKICDSGYLSAKEARYSQVNDKKINIDEYHQKNCVPEALNGYPGVEYNKKHALCITTNAEIAAEKGILDNAEKSYYSAYQAERKSKDEIRSDDFFAKAKLLPGILSANMLILLLAVCMFIFLGYIELQSILMKLSIHPDDEYHVNLRTYNANRRSLLNTLMDDVVNDEKNKILLDKKNNDEEITKKIFKADMNAVTEKALRELEVKRKIEILRNKGYDATADDLEKEFKEYLKSCSSSKDNASDIFNMSQSMVQQVEEINKISTNKDVAENIFNWILNNVEYDTEHSKEHYRTARETYNEKRGVCGELSVLYMVFLRSVNIDCVFCEITKNDSGKEVEHACIIIENEDGTRHLSDVAYKSFVIKHLEYREITDAELKNKYENWNQ